MGKRVFVTGGSGFVGREVITELLRRGHKVNALVHRGDLGELSDRVHVVRGDLFEAAVLDAGTSDCEAVIHLVGIIAEKPGKGVTFERIHVEGTQNVVDAAKRSNVRRYIHMSALGVRPDARSTYHQTKHRAEEYVRASGLDWTIIRPSMIHGRRGEFTRMQADWAKKKVMPFLFMPYFGAGLLGFGAAGRVQPVHVADVARAFVDALENPKTMRQSYDLAGPDVLTWPQLHRTVARAIVRKDRWVMPIPAWYASMLTRIVPASLLPFNRDQVIMSQEDNTADISPFVADFGWTPAPFREALATYAKDLRES